MKMHLVACKKLYHERESKKSKKERIKLPETPRLLKIILDNNDAIKSNIKNLRSKSKDKEYNTEGDINNLNIDNIIDVYNNSIFSVDN